MKKFVSGKVVLGMTNLSKRKIGWGDRQELVNNMFKNLFDLLYLRKHLSITGRDVQTKGKSMLINEDTFYLGDVFIMRLDLSSNPMLIFYTSPHLPLIFCKLRPFPDSHQWEKCAIGTSFMLTWFDPKRREDSMQSCVYINTTEFRPQSWYRDQVHTYPNFNRRYDLHNYTIYYSLACLSDCLESMGSSLEEFHLQIQAEIFQST